MKKALSGTYKVFNSGDWNTEHLKTEPFVKHIFTAINHTYI